MAYLRFELKSIVKVEKITNGLIINIRRYLQLLKTIQTFFK